MEWQSSFYVLRIIDRLKEKTLLTFFDLIRNQILVFSVFSLSQICYPIRPSHQSASVIVLIEKQFSYRSFKVVPERRIGVAHHL